MRYKDYILQIVFVLGLIILVWAIYFTRLAGLSAGDQKNDRPVDEYAAFTTAYQFEQEELRILTRLNVLKADYASDLMTYKTERTKIDELAGLSELEKREKYRVLDELYSNDYFQRKMDQIDSENKTLEKLRQAKCQKFCVYQDLPVSQQSL